MPLRADALPFEPGRRHWPLRADAPPFEPGQRHWPNALVEVSLALTGSVVFSGRMDMSSSWEELRSNVAGALDLPSVAIEFIQKAGEEPLNLAVLIAGSNGKLSIHVLVHATARVRLFVKYKGLVVPIPKADAYFLSERTDLRFVLWSFKFERGLGELDQAQDRIFFEAFDLWPRYGPYRSIVGDERSCRFNDAGKMLEGAEPEVFELDPQTLLSEIGTDVQITYEGDDDYNDFVVTTSMKDLRDFSEDADTPARLLNDSEIAEDSRGEHQDPNLLSWLIDLQERGF